MTLLSQVLLACGLTAVLVLLLRRPAERFGLVDHPGGRKRHGDVVPLTGGVAMTISFYVALSISLPSLADFKVLLALMAVLAAIGVADDLGDVSPRSKLIVQVAAAALMTLWGEHFLTTLGDLFGYGPIVIGSWGIGLSVFAAVAVVNSINMLDGMDGLAAGLVAVMLGYFALFAFWLDDGNALTLLAVLLGAVIGFLLFNAPHPWRSQRRTFMGDTGSLVLGFAVAWFSIDLTQRPAAAVPPVVMLWVFGLVLFDVFTVIVRRLLQRRNPTAADRAHIHHLLRRCGFSTTRAWLLLLAVNAGLGAIGVAGWRAGVPEPVLFGAFVVVAFAYFFFVVDPLRLIRWCRRHVRAAPAAQRR